jgi:endoglucanase
MKTLRCSATFLAMLLSALAVAQPAPSSPVVSTKQPKVKDLAVIRKDSISISGTNLYKNGVAWLPKGVTIVGLVAPKVVISGPYAVARTSFGAAELDTAKSVFGIDTVRFQISQPGLDPQSAIYDPRYAPEISSAVSLARSKDLVVILSMQAQAPSGVADLPCMPNDQTERAWKTIAPYIANSQDVLLELFNEPCENALVKGLEDWGAGMQRVLSAVRALGAENVVLLDGLSQGRHTVGLPMPNDTLVNRMALAVHPYLMRGFLTRYDWDNGFGIAADFHPQIATEWNFNSFNCAVGDPTVARSLLAYLVKKNIGLVGWAIDYPQTLVADNVSYTPTNWAGFTGCKDGSNSGAGDALTRWPAP